MLYSFSLSLSLIDTIVVNSVYKCYSNNSGIVYNEDNAKTSSGAVLGHKGGSVINKEKWICGVINYHPLLLSLV